LSLGTPKLSSVISASFYPTDPEDYVPPPPKASMGDLLAQALERSTIKDESSGSKPGKKGKKMKGQKICLTGGRMNIN